MYGPHLPQFNLATIKNTYTFKLHITTIYIQLQIEGPLVPNSQMIIWHYGPICRYA